MLNVGKELPEGLAYGTFLFLFFFSIKEYILKCDLYLLYFGNLITCSEVPFLNY